ncbi:MAG: hypothetical protein ABI693_28855 [Bryobacteraceae bacterium]
MWKGPVTALVVIASAFPQNPEAGHIEIAGREGILTVDAPRPVDAAAMTLAERYGIAVSVEDPVYQHPGTIKDVTAGVVRTPSPGLRVLVPLGGRLQVHFAVNDDGTPQDVPTLLQAIADAANAQFPFGWRLDATPGWLTLIPTRTTSAGGRTIASPALLDRKITIPAGTRSVAVHAKMLADALSADFPTAQKEPSAATSSPPAAPAEPGRALLLPPSTASRTAGQNPLL